MRVYADLCGPQEAAFEYDRQEQFTVAVVVEEHRDLIPVETLHGALAPPLAHDPRAHGEREGRRGPASEVPRSLSQFPQGPG